MTHPFEQRLTQAEMVYKRTRDHLNYIASTALLKARAIALEIIQENKNNTFAARAALAAASKWLYDSVMDKKYQPVLSQQR